MHSKVIIASLICMLAANFGNGKIANLAKNDAPKANDVVCNAPNDRHAKVTLVEDRGAIIANGWFEIIVDVPAASPAYNTVTRRIDPYDLIEGYFSQDGKLGITINIPSDDGDYYIGFEISGKEIAKEFIFVKDGKASLSSKSKYDARSQYFMDYVATDYDKRKLYDQDEFINPGFHGGLNLPAQQPKALVKERNFNAHVDEDLLAGRIGDIIFDPFPEIARLANRADIEKKYNNFVYNDVDDVYNDVTFYSNSSNSGTGVNVYTYWVDSNGNAHLMNDVEVNLYLCGERIVQQHFMFDPDNQVGDSFYLSASQTRRKRVKDIDIEVRARSSATSVFDNLDLLYSHVYTHDSTYALGNYSNIDYEFYFTTGETDRANAFEIADAQMVPYNYAEDFGHSLQIVPTKYPSDVTNYNVGDNKIYIRQEQASNWDVLNHEYGHYITKKLNYCGYYYWYENAPYRQHDMKENLIATYGPTLGKRLAYMEGLATYFGIASQLYSEINDVPGVGDYYYDDPNNNVFVNFNIPASGTSEDQLSHQGFEATVASILLKMMDNADRSGDYVSLGHETMWNLFARHDDIDDFIERVNHSSIVPDYIKNYQLPTLLKNEYHDVTFEGPARIYTNAAVDNTWTFTLNEESALLFSPAHQYDLVFVGENEDDTYVISNISLSIRSYTLTREQIINVLCLPGAKATVYARAFLGNNPVFSNSSKVEITKGNAYDLLCHWSATIDMTSRRYRWISIRATQNKTYQINIGGRWTTGQAVKLYNRIILDDEVATPIQTIYGTANGITFTRAMNQYDRIYMRIDNNCYRDQYSYHVSCAPIN